MKKPLFRFVSLLIPMFAACLLAAAQAVNLAPQATVSGQGSGLEALVDGVKQQHGVGEWIGGSPNEWYGLIHYPQVTLTWEDPQPINKLVFYDRPVATEHAAACVIKFSDGSEAHAFAIPNDGAAYTLVFEPRRVTSLTISVVDGIGEQIGFSEVEAYYDPEAKVECSSAKEFTDWVSYVDPTIETGRGRWFFCTPGSRPFGMISAAPYTRNKNQCGGGYNYNSNEILGFANIHNWIMSGVNLMPVTGDAVNPNLGEASWKSKFSHDTEVIEPGYHKLFLDRYQTEVEYTSTDRVALYRLNHRSLDPAQLLLQLGGYVGAASYVDGKAQLVSANRLEGSHGMTDRLWGGPKLTHVFFVMEFNRPITRMDGWKNAAERLPNITEFADPVDPERIQKGYYGVLQGKLFTNHPEDQAGVALTYEPRLEEPLLVKIGISYTSIENARNNLAAECPHWDFDRIRQDARAEWNEWLGKIEVQGGSVDARVKFYTDLWHVLLGRHKIDDFSGDYPTYMAETAPMLKALQERQAAGYPPAENLTERDRVPPLVVRTVPKDAAGRPKFHMYNSDATWISAWNLNILWGLGWPEVMDNFSASMLEYAAVGDALPRGPSGGGYTCIMRGCPATPLITATWQKGLLTKAEIEPAYQMMKRSNELLIRDAGAGEMVQGAFEYWTLAQLAEELGHHDDLPAYQHWIDGWKKYYDPEKQLLSGRWVEANDWQGTFGVSHDIPGLAALMGGNDALAAKLNSAFEQAVEDDFVFGYGGGTVSYANQPGLSNAHVFNYVGKPWLSQKWVRAVSRQAYGGTNPNIGYGGHDEDQGQMGAVSALMKIGLFSLRGTSSKQPIYEITSPEFDTVTIQLDPKYYSGKTFKIIAHDNAPENVYIQKAALNGKPLHACWFDHQDFARGGVLELWLGPQPNQQWGTASFPGSRD
jgi:putative alpha-1,2-mannosidase